MILSVQNEENWLTQVSEETQIQNRVFAKQVMCSEQNIVNWKEIDNNKKEVYEIELAKYEQELKNEYNIQEMA